MSKKTVKNMSELKDSRILYEKDLPLFGYILVSLIAILLIAVVIWSINTPKTYVIKSSGTVESTNKNYIMSAYTGEISQMNISEGSYVEKGDILFTVKSTDLDLQEEQITGQIDVYTANVEQLKKLEKLVMDGKNYFDLSADDSKTNDINDSSIKSQDKLAEKIRNSAEETIVAGNVKKISSEVLRELYGTDKKLIIECDGYDIYLDGCDISNAENELFTELDFTETDKGIMLSQSEYYRLPGKISIKLRNSKSDYKYFYMCSNDGKSLRKLNSLSGDNTFSINSAGDYLLTTERAESFRINIVWVLGAVGVILAMSVVYIFTKRKYWFW